MEGDVLRSGTGIRRSAVAVGVAALLGVATLVALPLVSRDAAPATLARTEFRRATGEPMIRVRVERSAAEVTLRPRSRLLVMDPAKPNEVLASIAGPSVMRVVNGSMTLSDDKGARAVDVPRIVTLREADGGVVHFDDAEHHGTLELSIADSGDAIDVIEFVPLETYVAGVIARELYPDWSPAAFEAQAITARSYALHERERRISIGSSFHVESTTQDQAYEGATGNPRAIDAVKRTHGMVLTYRGEILRTYYSSTCGGRAASARDTWPTGPGFEYNLATPIQAHERDCPCNFSTRYRWTIERPVANLALRFAEHGKRSGASIRSIDSVSKIEAHRLNRVGRPAAFEITDRRGKTWLLSGEQLRLAFNVDVAGIPPIDATTRVLSSDVVVTIKGDTAVIAGRGFGHGVGMCQFGAEGLARDGWTAREILAHYYPGSTLERAY